ncbi:hypothetical protein NQ317_002518, partial [Molorchus minor]
MDTVAESSSSETEYKYTVNFLKESFGRLSLEEKIAIKNTGRPKPIINLTQITKGSIRVNYGARYDIKVSTNFPGSQATDTVTYKVPTFLQPYKVKVTSIQTERSLIYWSEPYVPYYIDRVYYE